MNTIAIDYLEALGTEFIIGSYKDNLCLLDYRYRKDREKIDSRIQEGLNATYVEQSSPVIEQAKQELLEFLEGKRKSFTLKTLTVGTPFQKNVWNALLKLPYATTSSYKELSKLLNNQQAIRAVSIAIGANAISIIIPCHRVIGTDGELRGYAGGLDVKERVLELEKRYNKT